MTGSHGNNYIRNNFIIFTPLKMIRTIESIRTRRARQDVREQGMKMARHTQF